MNQRASYLLWSFVALLAFAAGSLWFLANYELVEETFHTAPGKEARINPYLAAERFLIKNDVDTNSLGGSKLLDELPSSNDTIFLANHRNNGLLTEERRTALNDWMSEGGHLITVIHTLWDEELNSSGDPFLDSYGVRQYKHDYSYDEDETEETPPTETRFAGGGETLTLDFNPSFYMFDYNEAAYAGIESQQGYHLLQIGVGAGTLTVLTDDWLWRNRKIGEHDHALFFHNLVQNSAATESLPKVWIVHDLEFPSLLGLIWNKAPYAVITIFLLLVFSLWAAYNRFGPPLLDNHRIRRSLLEHLDACGHYHWRHDQGNTLLATLRDQLQQLLERHHPSWHQLTPKEQFEWLSKRSNQPQLVLSRALIHQPQNEHEFTHIVQTLKSLRKTL